MQGVPGAMSGCMSGMHGWGCTDHVIMEGSVIHVACGGSSVCAVWTDTGEYAEVQGDWAHALTKIQEAHLVPAVTDEEVQQAVSALNEMVATLQRRDESMLVLHRECAHCGLTEERLFEDSWTGKEFCIRCLLEFVERLTNSPQSEGDNLEELLKECSG